MDSNKSGIDSTRKLIEFYEKITVQNINIFCTVIKKVYFIFFLSDKSIRIYLPFLPIADL